MGIHIGELPREHIRLESLKGKKIVVDGHNQLYQFIRTMPYLSHKGVPTSHLLGLFNRTTHLMELGAKLAFVFDGKFPEIKKHKKIVNYVSAPRTGLTLTTEMVEDAMKMLELLGLPVIQAPTEGEAQAAHMSARGECWAVASQDYDCLLYGADRIIRNLTFATKRKLPKGGKADVSTELIERHQVLKQMGITQKQLTLMAIICGTDFNPGVHGLGPKKALQLVKRYGTNADKLFRTAGWDFAYTWKEIYECVKTLPVTNKYKLAWKKPDKEGLIKFLVEERGFNKKNVEEAIRKL